MFTICILNSSQNQLVCRMKVYARRYQRSKGLGAQRPTLSAFAEFAQVFWVLQSFLAASFYCLMGTMDLHIPAILVQAEFRKTVLEDGTTV
jgi:hypothetical protein